MRDWKWSPTERAVARRAFDRALKRELDAVLREAKKRVAWITEHDLHGLALETLNAIRHMAGS